MKRVCRNFGRLFASAVDSQAQRERAENRRPFGGFGNVDAVEEVYVIAVQSSLYEGEVGLAVCVAVNAVCDD